MIFVTVGQMLGFDRLIRAMDEWASRSPDVRVVAQVGDGSYKPGQMEWTSMMALGDFRRTLSEADVVVAHAGMGSFFSAMEHAKPIVMMPRRAALREHTTDHQVHTLRWLRLKPGVFPADTESDLETALSSARASLAFGRHFSAHAPTEFIERLRKAINPHGPDND